MRQRDIVRMLQETRQVDVAQLVQRFGVTGMTIRRDLAELEAERTARLAEVNARIADKRAVAAAEVDAAKLAARSQVESAVADVASFAGQLATGKTPSAEAVNAAVAEAMGVSA